MDASSTMKLSEVSHDEVMKAISSVLPILLKRVKENPCPDDIRSLLTIQAYLNTHQGEKA